MFENKIPFKRKAVEQGGSIMVTIPPELLEYLEIQSGDEIGILSEISKYGKYISLWNVTKQRSKTISGSEGVMFK